MNAFEWQAEPMKSCGVHDHLQQAVKIMCETDCASVPVTDASGDIVGTITARDICIAAYRQCRPLWHMDVGSAMSKLEAASAHCELVERTETVPFASSSP
jgi:predicted transcriptional regulator